MDSFFRDIRYSFRRLRKSPVFTATVILTLALGIGANTAIFSVVNTVMLRPLPYRDPGALVSIEHYYPALNNMEAPVSAHGFKDYRDLTKSFALVGVETPFGANLTGTGDEPERVPGTRVSGDWFGVLGVPAQIGRTLNRDDDMLGKEHVVVLSHGLWTRLFAASPSAIGKTIELNGETYRIVGVMPEGFYSFFSRKADLFVPVALTDQQYSGGYTNEFLNSVARLKPGVTFASAQAEMTAFAVHLKKENPNQFGPKWTLLLRSLDDLSSGKSRVTLFVLLGAVGFVLLIACANVANLLLARAALRIKEIAIRSALGADRRSLVRQLLTESVMLSIVGGAFGLALARWGVQSIVVLFPTLPRASEMGIDANVMVFTLLVSIVTGLLFGLAPALQTSTANLQETLKDGSRSGAADFAGRTLRRALVVAEMALSLTLLIGAGLLIKSVGRLQNINPGFDPANVLVFNLNLPTAKYATDTSTVLFANQLSPRLNSIPGVRAAGATSVIPFGGGWSTASLMIENHPVPPGQEGPWGDFRIASPKFFDALRIPLRRGRMFEQTDALGAPRVAIIDEVFAKKYFANTDPIGKRFSFGDTAWITIVGVVGHAAHEALDAQPRIQYYFPNTQRSLRNMTIAVRTSGNPLALVSAVRAAVHDIDPNLPLSSINTMDKLVDSSLGQRKLTMLLLGIFSAIAVVLASIGIYGVMSYSVTQRTRELGVRMALGAARHRVLGLVVRQGMSLVGIGVVIGLIAAFALTRFLSSQLFGVAATDPTTFTLVSALLVGIALAATMIPALRATRVDPVVALRDE
jgi:putative ABC transport system permease protein